jgi:hypothetical protein
VGFSNANILVSYNGSNNVVTEASGGIGWGSNSTSEYFEVSTLDNNSSITRLVFALTSVVNTPITISSDAPMTGGTGASVDYRLFYSIISV